MSQRQANLYADFTLLRDACAIIYRSMDKTTAKQYNAATLAFLGDAVFTQFVREMLVRDHDEKSGGLHKMASSYVCAHAQSVAYDAVMPLLTDEEADVARRARNCHNNTPAKNATLEQYKKATGLEAVLGFLYVSGDAGRILELLNAAYEKGEEFI